MPIALFSAVALLASYAWWQALVISPALNLIVGPFVGGVLSAGTVKAFPGWQSRVSRLVSATTHLGTFAVVVLLIAAGVVPWLHDFQPSVLDLINGIHGEGLPGMLGVFLGVLVAVWRRRKS